MPTNKQAWPGTHQFTRVQRYGGRQEAGHRRDKSRGGRGGGGGGCDMIYNEIINLEKGRMASATSTLSQMDAVREQHVDEDTHFK